MLSNFGKLLVVAKAIDFILLFLILLLEILDFVLGHGFLLTQLFIEVLVFDAGVLFEVSPLVLQFIDLFTETFLVKSISLAGLKRVAKFPG